MIGFASRDIDHSVSVFVFVEMIAVIEATIRLDGRHSPSLIQCTRAAG